jgi:hypothetical protein
MKKMCVFLFVFLFNIPIAYANNLFVGVKFFGLSIHPKGTYNSQHMPLRFDRNGIFVLNTGISINIEYFVYRDIISVKFIQGLYADCVRKFGGFTHLGIRARIFEIERHSLYGGVGPTFIYRQNWHSLENYDGSFEFFRGNPEDTWQYRFLWYGGEFEYNYVLNDNFSLSTSFVPGFPDLLNLSFGLRARM